jgi:hypothetical protein
MVQIGYQVKQKKSWRKTLLMGTSSRIQRLRLMSTKCTKILYAHRAEFKDFPFIEEHYKDWLDKLQVIIFRLRKWAKYDCEAIKKDLERFPLKQQNIRGEPRWEGSQAEAKQA